MYLRTCVPACQEAFRPSVQSEKHKCTCVPAYVRTCVSWLPLSDALVSTVSALTLAYAGTHVRRYARTQVRRYAGTFGKLVLKAESAKVKTQMNLCQAAPAPATPLIPFRVFSCFFVFFRFFSCPPPCPRQLFVTFVRVALSLSAVYAAVRQTFLQQTRVPLAHLLSFLYLCT